MQVAVARPGELDVSEEKLRREFQSLSPMAAHPCFSLTYERVVCRARVTVAEVDGMIRPLIPYTKGDDGVVTTLGGGQTGQLSNAPWIHTGTKAGEI